MKFQRRFDSILQNFDIFGVPITIRFDSKETHKSMVGGFVTIIILGTLIYQVANVILDLMNYSQVNIIFQEEIVNIPKRFELTPKQFSFTVQLLTENLKYITDPEIFQFEATYMVSKKVLNLTTNTISITNQEVPFNMVPCTKNHFQIDATKDYFLQQSYQQTYCIDLNSQVELEGQYGADIYKRIRIRAKECMTGKCKDKAIRDKYLNNCSFQINYITYAIQVTNRTHPFQDFGQSYFWKTNNNTMKNINIYFRNTFLDSYEGLVQNSIKSHNKLFYSFDREQALQRTDNTLFELYINLEKNKESHYYRKYMTLNQAISQIGGLFNVLCCIGALISRPISRLLFQQKLLNQIFSFEKQEKSANTIQQSILLNDQFNKEEEIKNKIPFKLNQQSFVSMQQSKKYNCINKSNHSDIINSIKNCKSPDQDKDDLKMESPALNVSNQFNKRTVIEQNKEDIKFKKSILKSRSIQRPSIQQDATDYLDKEFNPYKNNNNCIISFFDLLRGMFSKTFRQAGQNMSPKSQMINYGLQKLNQHLEINYILDKLLEFEKLKHLLLNDQQKKLFDLIPKPVINKSYFLDNNQSEQTDNQKNHLFYSKNKTLEEKIKDASEAFNNLMNDKKEETSSVNKKLLQLLDPKLLVFLERNTMKYKQIQNILLQNQNTCSTFVEQNQINIVNTLDGSQKKNQVEAENELSCIQIPEENILEGDLTIPDAFHILNNNSFNNQTKIQKQYSQIQQ